VSILKGSQYEADKFPGLVYHVNEPKTALLLFTSGKVVCTGGKSLDDVRKSVDIVVSKLLEGGIPVERHPEITLQNIVATCDLGAKINLVSIVMSLSLEEVEYEPEQFPGLVYRLENPKAVCLLFGTGKMVITGARTMEDVDKAVETVRENLVRRGLL
jgi:transcription initiation factor TFIID TATA-box-binding protein